MLKRFRLMTGRFLLIASFLAVLPPLSSAGAAPGGASAPTIFVAAEVHAKPATPTSMPIMIGPPKSVPPGVVFLIRGLPPETMFSAGQSLNATTWIIPITEVSRLTIMPPANSIGVTELDLVLATHQGSILAQTKVKLIVSPPTARESKPQLKPANAQSTPPGIHPV